MLVRVVGSGLASCTVGFDCRRDARRRQLLSQEAQEALPLGVPAAGLRAPPAEQLLAAGVAEDICAPQRMSDELERFLGLFTRAKRVVLQELNRLLARLSVGMHQQRCVAAAAADSPPDPGDMPFAIRV